MWRRFVVPVVLLLLVPASLSASPGSLYEVGEEAVWVFEQKGQRIGENWFRYDGPVDLFGTPAHLFLSRVRLGGPALGGVEQRMQARLWTGSDGLPLRHLLEAQVGAQYSRVELFRTEGGDEGGAWRAIVVQGPSRRELDVDAPLDAILQTNNFIGYFELMLALDPPGEGEPFERTLLSGNVLRSFPYTATWKRRDADTGAAVLEDSLGETLWLGSPGRLEKLEIAAQSLVIRRDAEAQAEPFEIEPPAPAETSHLPTEEVSIRHGEVVLAGSVTTPSDSTGRLPAILFISGSGLQDRNGFSSGIDLGTHEILDRLTEAGFLVLRVDDRGAGASTGPLDDLTLDDLIADARASLAFLRQHERVDPARIALIGHSEGGTTAPILAAESPGVAAVVLMAATGRPLTEVIYEQNIQALAAADLTAEERATTLEQVRYWLDRAVSDEPIDPDELPADFKALMVQRPWLQSHARQDPIANLQQVRAPVLLLQGDKDFQVSLERDARVLAAALTEVDHEDFELISFPALDHLFKKTPGETSKLGDYFEDRRVDQRFLQALVDWLAQRLLETR